jgi:hypothetical protein
MLLRSRVLVLALIVVASVGADALDPADAADHIGEQATVCGVVASAKFASDSRGQPTFLNLDKPYPNHVFTALIWGGDRAAFSYPPESLSGTRICVEGRITIFRGKAQIIVSRPSQITR